MSHLFDLAFNLNLSAGIPGINEQSKTADKFEEYADALYNYTIGNLEELLSISNNDGYHVGMAFSHIVNNTPFVEPQDPFYDSNQRLKMSLYCATICLWRGVQMGTMQSIIATHSLIQLIDKHRMHYFEPIFMMLTGLSLGEIIEKSPDDIKNKTEKIYKCTKYYLIQLTRAQDAFKDANLKACELGEKYMNAIHDNMCDSLHGYMSLGVI